MCRSKIIFHKEKNSEKGLINSSSRDAARKGRGYYHLKNKVPFCFIRLFDNLKCYIKKMTSIIFSLRSQEKKQQNAGEMYIAKRSISSKIKSLDLTNVWFKFKKCIEYALTGF